MECSSKLVVVAYDHNPYSRCIEHKTLVAELHTILTITVVLMCMSAVGDSSLLMRKYSMSSEVVVAFDLVWSGVATQLRKYSMSSEVVVAFDLVWSGVSHPMRKYSMSSEVVVAFDLVWSGVSHPMRKYSMSSEVVVAFDLVWSGVSHP